jgi:hypothetical protein
MTTKGRMSMGFLQILHLRESESEKGERLYKSWAIKNGYLETKGIVYWLSYHVSEKQTRNISNKIGRGAGGRLYPWTKYL